MQDKTLNIHLIAIGGSVMHALAIALKQQGHNISGSDDQFFDPAMSALKKTGLLPSKTGWQPEEITNELDYVILGMHAQTDNPELLKAQEIGLKIVSFPEFIYEHSKNKQRIVIGGSHGKTTITSMIMHVLNYYQKKFDYVVGAHVKDFENRVQLSDAPTIIIEGDEYLSSRVDQTPKFLKYHHHIAVLSGISWDHINVFKTEEEYLEQFKKFALATPKAGSFAYNEEDELVSKVRTKDGLDIIQLPYKTLPYTIRNGQTYLVTKTEEIPVLVFGKHNLSNMAAAKAVLSRLSVNEEEFNKAISSFELPSLRMDTLFQNENYTVFRDYAHAPSKVKATTESVKEQFPQRNLVGVLELHTYSSLNKSFIQHYRKTLTSCDKAIVFFDPEALALKKLDAITKEDILEAFDSNEIQVVKSVEDLKNEIQNLDQENTNLLLMSSGNFGGLDFNTLFQNHATSS